MSNDKKLVLNILGMNNLKQAIHKIAPNGYQSVCGRMLKPKRIVGTALDSEVSCKICLAGGMSRFRLGKKDLWEIKKTPFLGNFHLHKNGEIVVLNNHSIVCKELLNILNK